MPGSPESPSTVCPWSVADFARVRGGSRDDAVLLTVGLVGVGPARATRATTGLHLLGFGVLDEVFHGVPSRPALSRVRVVLSARYRGSSVSESTWQHPARQRKGPRQPRCAAAGGLLSSSL